MIEFLSRHKYLLCISLALWLLINVYAYQSVFLSETRQLNSIYQRGVLFSENLVSKIKSPLKKNDRASLIETLRSFENQDDVYFIKIIDSENTIVAGTHQKSQQQEDTEIVDKIRIGLINGIILDSITMSNNERIVQFSADVKYSANNIGRAMIGLSVSELYSSTEMNKALFIVIVLASTGVLVLFWWAAYRFLAQREGQGLQNPNDLTRIGPYILIKMIGQGGMAELWKAERTSEDGFRRIVALKKILPHLTQDQNFINMFIREAKIAALLHHPNLVQITNYGQYQNNYFIAMEYVDGVNLSEIMERIKAGFPIDMTVFLALKIIAGLQYAHSKKDDRSGIALDIVHRDITPQNIMVSFEGEVKITDFGLARAQSEPSFTRTGQVKGKWQYMSPEQALGKKVDGRTDIYAFGNVIFEILTGHQVHEVKNEVDANSPNPQDMIPAPSTIRPDVPDELNCIVMKCLEKDREARYQTAQEIFHELLAFKKRYKIFFDATDLAGFIQRYFKEGTEI